MNEKLAIGIQASLTITKMLGINIIIGFFEIVIYILHTMASMYCHACSVFLYMEMLWRDSSLLLFILCAIIHCKSAAYMRDGNSMYSWGLILTKKRKIDSDDEWMRRVAQDGRFQLEIIRWVNQFRTMTC